MLHNLPFEEQRGKTGRQIWNLVWNIQRTSGLSQHPEQVVEGGWQNMWQVLEARFAGQSKLEGYHQADVLTGLYGYDRGQSGREMGMNLTNSSKKLVYL